MNTQELIFAFFVLKVFPTGRVLMYSRDGKSFVGNADASGATFTSHNTVNDAMEAAKKWSIHIWENNDRAWLVEEYGLTIDDVKHFMGYAWNPTEYERK